MKIGDVVNTVLGKGKIVDKDEYDRFQIEFFYFPYYKTGFNEKTPLFFERNEIEPLIIKKLKKDASLFSCACFFGLSLDKLEMCKTFARLLLTTHCEVRHDIFEKKMNLN